MDDRRHHRSDLRAAVWGVVWYRSRVITPASLLKRLPSSDALVIYLDFSALRKSGVLGMLDSNKVAADPEYQDFVRKTHFDYKQDLETAMLAFAPTGKFLLLRGRFDWKSLRSYAESEGGRCDNSFCRMQGSAPDRRISFFAVQSSLMALAVSEDESAALRMQNTAAGPAAEVPNAPVWIAVPSSVLQSATVFPRGPAICPQHGARRIRYSFLCSGRKPPGCQVERALPQ